MTTVALSTNCINILNFPDIGFGTDFKALKRFYEKDILGDFGNAVTLGCLDDVLQSLDEVFNECSEEGWDGYEAIPITEEAYFEAKRLIESLPITSFPMPEVIPEPSGEIGLEWYRGKRLVFTASVSGRNEIAYAGLFGANRAHGIEYFGDSLPLVILENLKRLYKD